MRTSFRRAGEAVASQGLPFYEDLRDIYLRLVGAWRKHNQRFMQHQTNRNEALIDQGE